MWSPDQDVDQYGRHADLLPDPYAARRLGFARYVALCQQALDHAPADPVDSGRELVMAWLLRRLLAQHERVVFVCGLSHARRGEALLAQPAGLDSEPLRRVRREGVTLYHLSAPSSREVMAEPAYLSQAFEDARASGAAGLDALDRLAEQVRLTQRAREAHLKESGETVPALALNTLFRFARNYDRDSIIRSWGKAECIDNRLIPTVPIQCVTAGAGVDGGGGCGGIWSRIAVPIFAGSNG